jgi:hypothetical protein
MPVADKPMEISSTYHTPQRRGRVGSTSSIVRKLLEKVVKPKQPQILITSGTISNSEEQRNSALAPFTMTGIAVGRVNRDYDAFFETAWGSSPTSAPKTSTANLPHPSTMTSALEQLHPQEERRERKHKEEKVPWLPWSYC